LTQLPKIPGRPTWAEIDLAALAHNFQTIRRHVGPDVKILAAVKANAYGHGAVACAHGLEAEGINWFGVALPEEGVELRQNGITRPILCLGGFWRDQQGALVQHHLTPVVYRIDMIEAINRAAGDAGVTADIHIKIDSGMGRLGLRPDAISEFCDTLSRCGNLRLDGVMTHLASADMPEHNGFTASQLALFDDAVGIFKSRGFAPQHIHAANSAAAFAFPESRYDMIRPGGSLYGFRRDVFPVNIQTPDLRPVLSLRSRIMLLKELKAGTPLGYGCTFKTQRDSVIATLPIGYDDGYHRQLSNRGRVLVRGQFAPVVGRVSMDLTLVDVTDVAGVSLDDEVTLLGRDGKLTIRAEDVAETIETISYEVTCGISSRVPRLFIGRSDGENT